MASINAISKIIEIAIQELSATKEKAEKMTVPELRERIRAVREPEALEDPLAEKVKGLARKLAFF